MADILLDVQSPSATPSAGQLVLYPDNVNKRLAQKDDAGVVRTLAALMNASSANQTGFSSDTYLTGSSIAIPQSGLKVGSIYRLRFDMAKTGAGTAAAAINIRFGTAGTTADTARLTFTFGAGTANADTGIIEVVAVVRTAGASGVLAGMARATHHLAATGLVSTGASGTGIILATSSAFDMTVANSIIGASFNGGASFSGTNTIVESSLENA